METTLCIIGAGGFGREVLGLYEDVCAKNGKECKSVFAEEDAYFRPRSVHEKPVLSLSEIDVSAHLFVIAIGDPAARKRIAEANPRFRYATLIHPSALLGRNIVVGAGSIVCAGCILTCDIRIGDHAHLNLATTVGHDATAGDFLTTAPAAHISGECRLGSSVYLGTGAILREALSIGDNITIGAGAVVLQNLDEAGIYAGVPAKRLR